MLYSLHVHVVLGGFWASSPLQYPYRYPHVRACHNVIHFQVLVHALSMVDDVLTSIQNIVFYHLAYDGGAPLLNDFVNHHIMLVIERLMVVIRDAKQRLGQHMARLRRIVTELDELEE